ncbi:MAG: hypothetical protein ACRELE_02055, partial [Gemmatimonadales bacterium]
MTRVLTLFVALQANVDWEHNGSTYEDKVPSIADADDFNPAFNARRAYGGYDDRELIKLAVRVQWDLEHFSV